MKALRACILLTFLIALVATAQGNCDPPVKDGGLGSPFGGTPYLGVMFWRGTYMAAEGTFTLQFMSYAGVLGFQIWFYTPGGAFDVNPETLEGYHIYSVLKGLCGDAWANAYTPRSPATLRTMGQAAQGFIVGDLNGDGNPDTVDVTSSGARVRLLNANRQATSTRTFAAGFSPEVGFSKVLLADFNGDSKLDIAITQYGNGSANSGRVGVLLGNGDGTFGTARTSIAGPYARALAAADFNSDGKIDLAIGTGVQRTVAYLPGTGDGGFLAPTYYASGNASSIVAADLNGDSRPDLAVTGDTSVSVFLNAGSGMFGTVMTTNLPFQSTYLAYTDLNSDGKVDLVAAARSSNALVLLFGNGNGGFQPPEAYVAGNYPSSVAPVPNDDGSTFLLSGESLSRQTAILPVSRTGAVSAPRFRFVGGTPSDVKTADLNGDGQPDVVVANGNIVVLASSADGKLSSPVGFQVPAGTGAVAIGDVNGDGRQDVLTAGGSALSVLLGRGDGTLQAATSTTVASNARSLTLADYNGDGKLDAAVASYESPGISILLGRGDGTFNAPTATGVTGLRPTAVYAADFNGDGKADLAALLSTPAGTALTLAFFAGQGNGTFAAARTAPLTRQDSQSGMFAAGDVNGDGKLDLAFATRLQLGLVLGDGAGGFTEASPRPTTYGGATGVAITDLNGDGKQDLVVTHCCGEADATYLLGNGNATFQAEVHLPSGSSPSAVAAARFAGDRLPGLVIVAKGEPGAYSTSDPTASGTVVVLGTVFADPSPQPLITTPTPGQTLTSASVTFTWAAIAGATKYKLEIGSTAGGADLYSQETTATSLAVSGLPTDGRTLYVRISAFVNGAYGTPSSATYRALTLISPLRFVPLPPCRLMETRAAYNFEGRTGAFGPPAINAAETRTLNLPASNVCSIPSTAKAYVVNTTLIPNGGGVGFATLFPAGEARPNVWTIRSPDGQIVANSAIVKAGTNGGISVYTSDRTDMLIDISGYYTDSTAVSGLAYYPTTPCRVIDTRADYRSPAGPFGPPAMAARQTRSFRFPATTYCTVPNASAYSVTITVVPPASLAYLTAWPNGIAQPNVSSINSFSGRVLANSVIIPASSNGTIDVFTFDATDFIIDINGYYAPDDGVNGLFYFPVTQCRASDSTVSGGAYADDTTKSIQIPAVSGCTGIPTNARGYAINVTALPNGNPMPFLTAYPTGQPRPNASILNAFQGQIVSNSAIVPAGVNGAIDIYAFRRTDVVVEVSGYFGR